MIKRSYEVEVLVNGRPLKEYAHDGKVYIEGREKTKFSLRLRNNSSERKLFIPSIDGLSVVDGKDAGFDSSGYIVNPWSAVTIDGWRTSDKDVAEFFFSSPKNSYGKKKGKGSNLGVIGVAVFGERKKQIDYFDKRDWPDVFPRGPFKKILSDPLWFGDGYWDNVTSTAGDMHRLNNAFFESATMTMDSDGRVDGTYMNSDGVKRSLSNQKLGTGFGDNKRSEVVTVDFEREDEPREVFEVFYNTRKELEKMGVKLDKEPLYIVPQSFPAERQYCEPPQEQE